MFNDFGIWILDFACLFLGARQIIEERDSLEIKIFHKAVCLFVCCVTGPFLVNLREVSEVY